MSMEVRGTVGDGDRADGDGGEHGNFRNGDRVGMETRTTKMYEDGDHLLSACSSLST